MRYEKVIKKLILQRVFILVVNDYKISVKMMHGITDTHSYKKWQSFNNTHKHTYVVLQ